MVKKLPNLIPEGNCEEQFAQMKPFLTIMQKEVVNITELWTSENNKDFSEKSTDTLKHLSKLLEILRKTVLCIQSFINEYPFEAIQFKAELTIIIKGLNDKIDAMLDANPPYSAVEKIIK